jgi:hypothetical protein
MEDGTIRELQSVLEILKARLVIFSEIHHLSISTAKLDMLVIKNKTTYHIEHIVTASFLGNRLLKLHFAN